MIDKLRRLQYNGDPNSEEQLAIQRVLKWVKASQVIL